MSDPTSGTGSSPTCVVLANSAWTRRLTASLTKRVPSIALGCTAGALGYLPIHGVPEATGELWAVYFLVWPWAILGLQAFLLMRESESGPTTPLTTATLLRTKGWRSVGSRTPSSGCASPAPAARTTGSRPPKSGPWVILRDPPSWTWCPTKRQWSTPAGVVTEAAFAALPRAERVRLLIGSTPMEPGDHIRESNGLFSLLNHGRRHDGIP